MKLTISLYAIVFAVTFFFLAMLVSKVSYAKNEDFNKPGKVYKGENGKVTGQLSEITGQKIFMLNDDYEVING